MPKPKPEAAARAGIDRALEASGWVIQDADEVNLYAAPGVAVREFPMASGHGFADYLLFVDQKAVAALEAKKVGHTLTGVEGQAQKYSDGLPGHVQAPIRPLPFLMLSTGVQTTLTNRLDPHPRSREIFAPPRPETMREWLAADPLKKWMAGWHAPEERILQISDSVIPSHFGPESPSTLRARLRTMPPSDPIPGLWPNQIRAITNLERSLAADKPRALVQMATGSGKSLTAVAQIYRLIKFGGARRILFLVDRDNLATQAYDEFVGYRSYDDHRKFTELYTPQRLTSNTIGASSKVVITTIQRLYSILKGEPDFDPEVEQGSAFDSNALPNMKPAEVEYNAGLPPEYFDFIFIDECHRSIYTLWGQVLDYFDAYLVGLTATPAKHTFGFFNKNLVMEYTQEMAVADGVNVDFDIYRIRTKITEGGASLVAAETPAVKRRNRMTRAMRWERPDDDITYGAEQLDRDVVASDQIRLIVKTFKERLFTEIFPGRTQVPKTLIFAKDDSHAEDIVGIVREEFGKGNQFCQKITYKVTGTKPKQLIQDFRTDAAFRIAVTVDMVATGTDVRPIEIVMFMRSVKSNVLYEQMKGRGGRVAKLDEMRSVTADAKSAKTHFVLIDCVGVTEQKKQDTQPLDGNPSVSMKKLLQHVAVGGADPDLVASLASRLIRLNKQCGPKERAVLEQAGGGVPLSVINHALVEALDVDVQAEAARSRFSLPSSAEPTDEQRAEVAIDLIRDAVRPLASNPALRTAILELKQSFEQLFDEVSIDTLTFAGASPEAKAKAASLVQSFEDYLHEHQEEIDALQFFYSQPHRRRLTFKQIKTLAEAIEAPPRRWTPERLWHAYEQLDEKKVKGASGQRLLTDMVSLIRFALHKEDELVPYGEQVRSRFDNWLAQQENTGRTFTDEQRHWLTMIRDHVAQSLEIELDDFDLTPFVEQGGLGKAAQVFGGDLAKIVGELNEALSA
jgi:type I restriction enzyme, R subunit